MWQAKIEKRIGSDEPNTEERRPFILSMHEFEVSKRKCQHKRSRLCDMGCARRESAMRLWCTEPTREDRSRRSYAGIWVLGVRCGRLQVLLAGSERQVGRKRRGGGEGCTAFHTLVAICEVKRVHTVDSALICVLFHAVQV